MNDNLVYWWHQCDESVACCRVTHQHISVVLIPLEQLSHWSWSFRKRSRREFLQASAVQGWIVPTNRPMLAKSQPYTNRNNKTFEQPVVIGCSVVWCKGKLSQLVSLWKRFKFCLVLGSRVPHMTPVCHPQSVHQQHHLLTRLPNRHGNHS